MRTIVSVFVSLLPATTMAFLPAPHRNAAAAIIRSRVLATPKPDTSSDALDIEHAKYCTDHFGECSLEDMGRIRNALHQERVTNVFTGAEEDIEHELLETDLTFQMGLIQDQLATEYMNPYSSTMSMPPVLDGGLDQESSEALMICVVIGVLALLPQFL